MDKNLSDVYNESMFYTFIKLIKVYLMCKIYIPIAFKIYQPENIIEIYEKGRMDAIEELIKTW